MKPITEFIKENSIIIYDVNITARDNISVTLENIEQIENIGERLEITLLRSTDLTPAILKEFINTYFSDRILYSIEYDIKSNYLVKLSLSYDINKDDSLESIIELRDLKLSSLAKKVKVLFLKYNLLNTYHFDSILSFGNNLLFLLNKNEFCTKIKDDDDGKYAYYRYNEKGQKLLEELKEIFYFKKELLRDRTIVRFNKDKENFQFTLNLPIAIEQVIQKEILKEVSMINLLKLGDQEIEKVFSLDEISVKRDNPYYILRIPINIYNHDKEHMIVDEYFEYISIIPKMDNLALSYINRIKELDDTKLRVIVEFNIDKNKFYLILKIDDYIYELFKNELNLKESE